MVDSVFFENTDYQVREINYTESPVTAAASTAKMENYFKSPYAKRYIIEDSIPKVTTDGEPHEVMTLVAGVSGMLTAIVILGILVTLIGCKNKERQRPQSNPPPSPGVSEIPEMDSKRSSILPLFTKSISVEDASPRLVSISVISNNLGKLNPAFIASEMSLERKKGSEDVPLGNIQKF